jgi:hypothetical protein
MLFTVSSLCETGIRCSLIEEVLEAILCLGVRESLFALVLT